VPNISLAASLVVGSFLPAQHNMQSPTQAAGSRQQAAGSARAHRFWRGTKQRDTLHAIMPKGDDNKPNWHDRLMPIRVWHSAEAQWLARMPNGHNYSSADSDALSRNRMGLRAQ
jgi:hypothetical protein